jgi:hypothetical protein
MARALLIALLCAASASAVAAPEPAVQRTVIEDDGARIEELRVRGLNQRIVVRPKAASAPEYEILLPQPGRDVAQDRKPAGQRVWRVLSF